MKHAYLIMAHNNFEQLKKLLCLLDDKRNDIFLHINMLVKDIPLDTLISCVNTSNLIIMDRLPVYWGDFSVSNVILSLLKKSHEYGGYAYYHLLSGVDLPIKTQDYIHNFFDQHYTKGTNFINTYPLGKLPMEWYKRCSIHNILTRNFRNSKYFIRRGSRALSKLFCIIQEYIHVDRIKEICMENDIVIMGGSTWFSITDSLVNEILISEQLIRLIFEKNTIFADEMFVQTIAWSKKFGDTIFDAKTLVADGAGSLRYIDWNRGNPYVWREADYDELINSNYLFARKFDEKIDNRIIDKIFFELRK